MWMPESIYQRRELIMKNKLNNREKHQGQSREVRGNVEKIGDPVILSLPADLRVVRYFLSCMKEIRNQKVCTDSIRNTRAKLLGDSKKNRWGCEENRWPPVFICVGVSTSRSWDIDFLWIFENAFFLKFTRYFPTHDLIHSLLFKWQLKILFRYYDQAN